MDRPRRCSEARPARSRGPVAARGQRGIVLIIALVFLVVLTTLALNEMRRTSLQQGVATSERDHLLAQQYAELALRDAERDLLGLNAQNAVCLPTTTGCREALDSRTGVDGQPFASAASRFTSQCINGQCADVPAPGGNPADPTWIARTNCVTYGRYTGALIETAEGLAPIRAPCYALEWMPANAGGRQAIPVIRITAWGWGRDRNATPVVVQEVFNRGPY
ncbi:pilus assembly PilX family protein [Derxia gummosa]|uniref:Pilus assembly PilX family protein n=1 Tax=Derxia gummosa DSM 723 TaxID=1121388 RepID=A0A8B6X7A5_9BURK|nr:PilX N-terminal domain-containing pilus assembly protein [Derxia gummosa]